MTFAQFNALLERRKDEQEREDFYTARVCAALANIYREKDSKAYSPRDFMLSKPPEPQAMDADAFLNYLIQANAACGGKLEINDG